MDNKGNLHKILYDIIKSLIKEKKREYFGKVVSVESDNKKAEVKVIGSGTMNLLNKSGEILCTGDSVLVYAINGDLSNAVILLRYGKSNANTNISDANPQAKSVVPTADEQIVFPDTGYNCLSQVTVAGIPYEESSNDAGGKTVTIG